MGNRKKLTQREMAVEALEKSTKMLKVASALRKQGNQIEADRLRDEARAQRIISTLLMAEANRLEQDFRIIRSQQNLHTFYSSTEVRH
jgi:hypothetical protein